MIMKNFKFIYLLIAAVSALAFTACDKHEWTPGEADNNLGVYFASTADVVVTAEDTSATILVKRLVTAGDEIVTVRSQEVTEPAASGFFTVDDSVMFTDGSDEAELNIKFNGADLTPGTQYQIAIQLDPNQASKYGISEATFAIGIAEPWNVLGTGYYRDDFLGPMYSGPAGVMIPVEIAQHGLDSTRYRLIEPFSATNCAYIIGGVPSDMEYTTPGYIEFIIDPETNNVEIVSSWLGFKLDVGTGQPENFWMATVYEDENTPMYGYYDAEKGIVSFPTPNSVMWHIDDGRGNYANQSGLMAFVMPGFSLKDYSIVASYAGIDIAADNTTAAAIINFTFGSDVTDYRFTVVEGAVTDITATVEGIVADSLGEDVVVFEASVEDNVWALELTEGIYTIVAVPYAGSEAQVDDASSTRFYVPNTDMNVPEGEFVVAFDSVANITGNPEYEAQFPGEYAAALLVEGDANEIMSVTAWLGDTSSIEGTTLEYAYIIANYGTDFSSYIPKIAENGYVILGPYDFMSGSSATALVAIQTVYGKTQVYRVDHKMPYSGTLAIGDYVMTDGEGDNKSELLVTLTGGYAPAKATDPETCFLHMSGFDGTAMYGVVDPETKTITFNGLFDGQADPLFGEMYNYYGNDGSKAYGYFSSATETFEKTSNMVITLDENNAPVGLTTHFGCFVFNLADGSQAGVVFYFSPETTIAPAPEAPATDESQPATFKAARKASALPELNSGLRYSNVNVEKFDGVLPVRELKHKAVLR